jgi:CheY-like chemotaxis protein
MEPGPDGWTVAATAREDQPGIAVVYMTGDSMSDWRAKGVTDSVLVAKPFVPEQVLAAIASLLPGTG